MHKQYPVLYQTIQDKDVGLVVHTSQIYVLKFNTDLFLVMYKIWVFRELFIIHKHLMNFNHYRSRLDCLLSLSALFAMTFSSDISFQDIQNNCQIIFTEEQ